MKKRDCIYCEPGECVRHWLYVVADKDGSGPVKVGISNHATRRLAHHRKKTGRDLCVHFKREFPCEFDAIDAESAAIAILEEDRTRGDWFDCPVSEVIKIVKGIKL